MISDGVRRQVRTDSTREPGALVSLFGPSRLPWVCGLYVDCRLNILTEQRMDFRRTNTSCGYW